VDFVASLVQGVGVNLGRADVLSMNGTIIASDLPILVVLFIALLPQDMTKDLFT
jgi:hypothetical protein